MILIDIKTWKIVLLAILIAFLFVVGRLVYWVFFEPMEFSSPQVFKDVEHCSPNPASYDEQCYEYRSEFECNQADEALGCTWYNPSK